MDEHRSIADHLQSDPVHIVSSQEIPSSPPSIVSEAGARRKPKRPPPVTPRSFKRFFTPRSSLRSADKDVQTNRHALRELSSTSLNRRGPAFTKATTSQTSSHGILKSPFIETTKTPSRKRKLSFSSTGSPLQSSPLRKVQITTAVYNDCHANEPVDEVCLPTSPEKFLSPPKSLQKQLFPVKPPAGPVRRSKVLATSGELCLRSVSGRMNRLTMRSNYGCGWQDQASNFYSRPEDQHQSINIAGDHLALPVCIAPCKTNSLVAIGDEEGGIRLLDTAKGVENGFSNAHLSFRAHGNSILNLEFSSDDLLLATAAGDQTTLIIDIQTQKPIHCLSNHTASVKHVQFQPASNNRIVATCSRDGAVNIWDLRCRGYELPSLQVRCSLASDPDDEPAAPLPKVNYPQPVRTIQDAHTFMPKALKLTAADRPEPQFSQDNVAVTSLSFLPAGRENLFVTASSTNACVRLWDLRTSYNIRKGHPAPLSTTREPDCHVSHRSWGVTSMALNSDGSRLYTLCRDAYVYAYSTSHLILGGSPDMNMNNTRPRRTGGPNKEGLGPLYRFGDPGLQVSSFYVKTALRPAKDDRGEILAVGNSESSAVLFPTDEKFLEPINMAEPELPPNTRAPLGRPGLRRTHSEIGLSGRPESVIPTYRTGTRLIEGHQKEVSAVAWAHGGELVTVSDDFSARCWREGPDARDLRIGGEANGQRWRCGWADARDPYDEDED